MDKILTALVSSFSGNPLSRWWAAATRPPGRTARLGWRDWLRVGARSIDGALRDDYGIVASSIAFAAFLAILPLLGLVALTYSWLVPADVVQGNIATLTGILPGGARSFVQEWLTNSLQRHQAGSGIALAVSAGVTIFSARRAGRSLLHGVNVANGIEHSRGPLSSQIAAILIVLVGAGLLLAALVSISMLALLRHAVPADLPGASRLFRLLFWGSLTAGPAASLLFTYRYAAARSPVPWRQAIPGMVVAVVLWLATTLALQTYVSRIADYRSTYGSLSAIVVLQLWLMLSAFILLLGAKINAEAMRSVGAHDDATAEGGDDADGR